MQSNLTLGQNFLIDKNVIRKMLSNIPKNSEVLEIGPGMGALSLEIQRITDRFVMIEKDARMIEYLKNKVKGEFILGDCLDCCLDSEFIVTNLPYNISNKFLQKIISSTKYETLIIMLQKEFAAKILCADNALGILVQLHSNVECMFHVDSKCFFPQPKVDSTVLKMKYKKNIPCSFIKNIKNIYMHTNRKIKNNFSDINGTRPNSLKLEVFQNLLEKYY